MSFFSIPLLFLKGTDVSRLHFQHLMQMLFSTPDFETLEAGDYFRGFEPLRFISATAAVIISPAWQIKPVKGTLQFIKAVKTLPCELPRNFFHCSVCLSRLSIRIVHRRAGVLSEAQVELFGAFVGEVRSEQLTQVWKAHGGAFCVPQEIFNFFRVAFEHINEASLVVVRVIALMGRMWF